MATITLNYDGRSALMKHLVEAMLAGGAKVLSPSTSDSDFYANKDALQSFQLSVEQEKQGRTREVSLDEVKQMLNL